MIKIMNRGYIVSDIPDSCICQYNLSIDLKKITL